MRSYFYMKGKIHKDTCYGYNYEVVVIFVIVNFSLHHFCYIIKKQISHLKKITSDLNVHLLR
jgi:hypothetical protein